MPRLARPVFAKVPHHITQRGNRREVIFLTDDDRQLYLVWDGHHDIQKKKCKKGRVALGHCSPRAPTDPYVQDYRIRFLKSPLRCTIAKRGQIYF